MYHKILKHLLGEGWVDGKLFGWMVVWTVGWLVGPMVGWKVECMVGWFVRLDGWLYG